MTGRGRDAVDADQRRKLDRELAHEMIRRGLARVVGDAAFLRHDRVRTSGEDEAAAQALLGPDRAGLIGHKVGAGDVDREGQRPFFVGDVSRRIGRDENSGRDRDRIEAAVGEHGTF